MPSVGEQMAQAAVDFLAVWTLPFLIFLVIEWALSFFRSDS